MEEKKEGQKKLSYEELEQYASQMSQQCQQLYARMNEMHMGNVFKRLDYLFKVLEFDDKFDYDFVEKCMKEIVEIMTPDTTEDKE